MYRRSRESIDRWQVYFGSIEVEVAVRICICGMAQTASLHLADKTLRVDSLLQRDHRGDTLSLYEQYRNGRVDISASIQQNRTGNRFLSRSTSEALYTLFFREQLSRRVCKILFRNLPLSSTNCRIYIPILDELYRTPPPNRIPPP